ncbi:MAG: hypothetical protein Alis3KO_00980 [Aliiglaciecola sp.]
MLYEQVIARVKPLFKQVGGAANIVEAVKQNIPIGNIGFVIPLGEQPMGNRRDVDIGAPLQEAIITFGVLSGIRVFDDAAGDKSTVAIEQHSKKVLSALYGWKPNGEYDPILLGNSALVKYSSSGMWWLQRFTTNTWYQGKQ